MMTCEKNDKIAKINGFIDCNIFKMTALYPSKCVIFNIELLVLYSCKLMFAVLVSDCKNSLLKSLVIILALLYSMSNYIRSYMYP